MDGANDARMAFYRAAGMASPAVEGADVSRAEPQNAQTVQDMLLAALPDATAAMVADVTDLLEVLEEKVMDREEYAKDQEWHLKTELLSASTELENLHEAVDKAMQRCEVCLRELCAAREQMQRGGAELRAVTEHVQSVQNAVGWLDLVQKGNLQTAKDQLQKGEADLRTAREQLVHAQEAAAERIRQVEGERDKARERASQYERAHAAVLEDTVSLGVCRRAEEDSARASADVTHAQQMASGLAEEREWWATQLGTVFRDEGVRMAQLQAAVDGSAAAINAAGMSDTAALDLPVVQQQLGSVVKVARATPNGEFACYVNMLVEELQRLYGELGRLIGDRVYSSERPSAGPLSSMAADEEAPPPPPRSPQQPAAPATAATVGDAVPWDPLSIDTSDGSSSGLEFSSPNSHSPPGSSP